MYGYEPEELVGKAQSSILDLPEDVQAGKPRQIRDAALRDGRWEGRVKRRAKDDRQFGARVVVAPWRDAAGSPVGFVLTSRGVQDIAEWKLAEEALGESQQRFQAIFENALDAILIIDDTGRYIDANPAASALGLQPRRVPAYDDLGRHATGGPRATSRSAAPVPCRRRIEW